MKTANTSITTLNSPSTANPGAPSSTISKFTSNLGGVLTGGCDASADGALLLGMFKEGNSYLHRQDERHHQHEREHSANKTLRINK